MTAASERSYASNGRPPPPAPGAGRRFRRVPVRLQMSNVECGAACLAMILSYHGRNTRTAECREHCDAGRDGVSARALASAARAHGLRVRVLRAAAGDLSRCALPAVVHWSGNHFLVVERVSASGLRLVDPALGRTTVTHEEFRERYSGFVLEMTPVEGFHRRRRSPHPVWRALVRQVRRTPGLAPLAGQIAAASLLVAAVSLSFPLAMQVLVDRWLPLGRTDLAGLIGGSAAVLAVGILFVTYLRQALLVFVQARLDEQLMTDFFRHLLSLPLRFFQRRSSGDLLMRLTSNTHMRELLASHSISTIIDGGLATLYLGLVFLHSRMIGTVVAVVGGLHVLFLLLTTRTMHTLMRRDLALQAVAQGYLVDVLTGIASVKASGGEVRVWDQWGGLLRRQLEATMVRGRLGAMISATGTAITVTVPIVVLGIGAVLVVEGRLTLGALLAVATITAGFLGPLTSLVARGQQFQLAGAYAERLADVLETPVEQHSPPPRSIALRGAVELRDVEFRYDDQARPALRGIDLQVPPGRRVAVVGPTGSGKSTLALVLLTLHQPQTGSVRFDGVAVEDMNYQLLRRNFGAVLQDAPTLDGTLREILAWHDGELPQADLERAARIACIHEDILALPMGYDTRVGERGHALSGGQRQRLAIARAVAHRPKLLVLDEATSHLDTRTEAQIVRNLSELDCTQVLVAHRLSTVIDADEILVMEDGRIRARGTNEELLEGDALYRALMEGQFLSQGPSRTGARRSQQAVAVPE